MATVKGSTPYHYKVVRYRPIARLWKTIAILLIASLFLAGAFWLGQTSGTFEQQKLIAEIEEQQSQLQTALAFQAELHQRYETARLGAEIDRGALEQVRVEVTRLKQEISELQEENVFYRNLMSPEERQTGLAFGPIDIIGIDRPGAYRFKVVMQQLATQHNLLNGKLIVNIVGRRAGQPEVLALHTVSDSVDEAEIDLRFKYFQNVEGELILPQGFEPERLELQARASKPSPATIEKRVAWPLRAE